MPSKEWHFHLEPTEDGGVRGGEHITFHVHAEWMDDADEPERPPFPMLMWCALDATGYALYEGVGNDHEGYDPTECRPVFVVANGRQGGPEAES